MNVWFAIPSARPVAEAEAHLRPWRARGYYVALLRQGDPVADDAADLQLPTGAYMGWAASTNHLAREILSRDPKAAWIVGGGDDYYPDPARAAVDIALECEEHFRGTLGVMQPTGDRWGEEDPVSCDRYPNAPALIDRVCGSPWLGRDWCLRAYGGRGPLWAEYHHMFADEELLCVARLLGLLWQRRDLTQMHDHWSRNRAPIPEFLKPVNTESHWDTSRSLFRYRREAGFPGHELLPISLLA